MNGTVERAITSSTSWDESYQTMPHYEVETQIRGPMELYGWCHLNMDTCDVMRVLPDESIDLIFADPPYGVDFQSNKRPSGEARRFEKIANDKTPFIWWLKDSYRITKSTGSMVCFTRWDVRDFWIECVEAAGWKVKGEVIWDKMSYGMGDLEKSFAPSHETIIFAVREEFAFPTKRPLSVLSVPRIPLHAFTHPNEKPIGIAEKLLRILTREGDVVLDPFSGSGVCGEAAVRNNRLYIGIDMDTEYAALSAKRTDRAYQNKLKKERMT